jgi:hypothetical protein
MQFVECNARALGIARSMGRLVTRLGQLVARRSETQIAKFGLASKFVAVVECASAFGYLRPGKSLWIFGGDSFGVRPPGAALARNAAVPGKR